MSENQAPELVSAEARTPFEDTISSLSASSTDAKPQNYDDKWAEVKLAHDRQRHTFKMILFWGALAVCGTLYAFFFIFLVMLFCNTHIYSLITTHKHMLALFIALLIVPSAILWGLVQAIFKINQDASGLATEIIKLAPQLSVGQK